MSHVIRRLNARRSYALAALVAVTAVATAPCLLRAQGSVSGSVTDTAGVPVLGAEVDVEGTAAQTRTDEQGHFAFLNVPLGDHSVTVRRLGFAPARETVRISAESDAQVAFRMTPIAAMLPPVVVRPAQVRYTGRLAGYYKRLERRSSGEFITREQIDRANPSDLVELLAQAPGIQAFHGHHGVDAVRMRGRSCWPIVWLDGTPMGAGEVDLDAFVPSSIQGIELYLGSTTAPLRYTQQGDRSSCGTILIWSRGPDTDPIQNAPSERPDLDELIAQKAVYTSDDVDRPARRDSLDDVSPVFPPSLFASRTSGLVVAEFVVDTVGKVERETVGIVSSTAPPFSAAVRSALDSATFVPALKDGHRVRQLVHQPFKFDIGATGQR
jgi:TonB family protein